MKKSLGFVWVLLAMLLVAVLATPAARAWDPFGWFGKKRTTYQYLLVTGNFVHSRILAELIQRRLKTPVLLLPTGIEQDVMYALGPDGKAVEVRRGDLVEFVRTMQPGQVVFLGNTTYVPQSYIEEVSARFPSVVFAHSDWEKTATAVEGMMQIENLARDYKRLLTQLDGQGQPKPNADPATVWGGPAVEPPPPSTPQP